MRTTTQDGAGHDDAVPSFPARIGVVCKMHPCSNYTAGERPSEKGNRSCFSRLFSLPGGYPAGQPWYCRTKYKRAVRKTVPACGAVRAALQDTARERNVGETATLTAWEK